MSQDEGQGKRWEHLTLEQKVEWLHEKVVDMIVRGQIADEEITAMLKDLDPNKPDEDQHE